MEEFSVRGKEPKDEVQIYTWKDATLRELTDLVCLCTNSLSLFFYLHSFIICLFMLCYIYDMFLSMNVQLCEFGINMGLGFC